ncbi:MAG: amidohydrolase family protein [Spirochaetaceae bacterium]|nr:amidohydrolase family protein [Spirochaetaceae bacterium]MCF7948388.1 amidohydrolase family protein [Spirochaetia bacterium]MCF7951276.1 amidohydrolase family protein [Spirochaetaceae bacterium]
MSSKYDVVIKNGFVVYPDKTVLADVGINGDSIAKLGPADSLSGTKVINAEGCYVLPGLIDPHTHPVYLDNLQDLSKTAAWGGVTTVIHYAYAKPGQSLLQIIKQWKEEAGKTSYIDFALHGGLFETIKQADELPDAFKEGVTSFKMFLSYAKLGWMTDDYALTKAMDIIGREGGMAALHAENGLAIDYIQDKLLAEKADITERFLETSPALAEAEAIFRSVYLGRLMKCPVYIPHISSREAMEVIEYLKSRKFPVIAETCPQYLSRTWDILKEFGPLGKVGPAIKTQDDQDALWDSVENKLIDTIGSDHAPKPKKIDDNFFDAPYGTPEIETMLANVWHSGVNSGKITPNDIARITSENSARIMGLFPKKGRLDEGSDADIVVFDPAKQWTISHTNQHTNASYSIFEGREILGKVDTVLSRGKVIIENDTFSGQAGDGKFHATKSGEWFKNNYKF